MTYRHYAQAEGTLRFPLDMLRYDGCYPDDQASVAQMYRSLDGETSEPLRVRIVQISPESKAIWTPARWASFGWTLAQGQTLKC